MKIDKEFTLFAKGNFTQSLDFKIIKEEIHSAIQHVVWGSENLFLINVSGIRSMHILPSRHFLLYYRQFHF